MEAPNILEAMLKIQKMHVAYFYKHHKNITDCVVINWRNPVSISIKDKDLPIEVRDSIEKLLNVKL